MPAAPLVPKCLDLTTVRYSPFLSCRQAAYLITARLDRPLGVFERAGLGLHLRICSACPIVIRQLDEIRRSVGEWRQVAEHERAPTDIGRT